jgi:hypothetical protein
MDSNKIDKLKKELRELEERHWSNPKVNLQKQIWRKQKEILMKIKEKEAKN